MGHVFWCVAFIKFGQHVIIEPFCARHFVVTGNMGTKEKKMIQHHRTHRFVRKADHYVMQV